MSICLRCRKAQRPKRHTWWSHSNTLLSAQCVHKGMAPSPFAACHDCAAVTFAHTCLVYQSLVLHNAYILLSATHPPPSHTHTHTHTHTHIFYPLSLSPSSSIAFFRSLTLSWTLTLNLTGRGAAMLEGKWFM